MRFTQRSSHQAAAIMATLLASGLQLHSSRADAQESHNDDWQFRATVYGYLPSLGGSTKFPSPGSSIDVNSSTILNNLKFAFMGALEAQKGPWGAFTDVMYLNLGGSKSGTRELSIGGMPLPIGVTANASLDMDGWVWTAAGNYRALVGPQVNLDLFAGTRLVELKQSFRFAFSGNVGPFIGPGRQGSAEARLDDWDGIVGAKGRYTFGGRHEWFASYYLDVGTGESQLTWQAIGGLGYAFNWGELVAAWRYLGYDFESGKTIESLNFSGPALAVAFRW